jgi:hypothetical protein
MRRKLLLLVPTLFALLLPNARSVSATPPETPKAAPAPPPADVKKAADAKAKETVERQLVQPLAAKEGRRTHFSRGYIPPQARRVRVLDGEKATDRRGAEFVTFAVDERYGLLARDADDPSVWRQGVIVGCVYPARDEVFVRRGDKFFGAGLLLGQKTSAADEAVCRPTTSS